ncbi:two component transcriptional regulator, AraC family [Spirochaeta thermophila DSM 6578]|uniref:Two component transcriptional regulator, AraC family n=1 Tax=Winmispira thermophila (strain ATCC 700085 / DSM 6578 / Z-1203) TaxID=869211 RepID=G0GFI0_WINT7|nr:response regulator [Spirochaeta thermophila]AEJ61594.1 two component transcriptional regulator, AraC family [Spirochaeta thermophila DSM 6578]
MIRVMLVDDEPPARRFLKGLIEGMEGFVLVGEAEDGAEALSRIRVLDPDLVITDVKMPVMDGIDLAHTLVREHPLIPLLVVSAYDDFEYVEELLHTGVVHYLLKPVNPERMRTTLAEMAASLLELRRRRQETNVLALLLGEETDAFSLGARHLWMALGRVGAPPPRYRLSTPRSITEVDLRDPETGVSLFVFQGRDAHEHLYLSPAELPFARFSRLVRDHFEGFDRHRKTRTLILRSSLVVPGDLHRAPEDLYKALDEHLVLGRARILRYEDLSYEETDDPVPFLAGDEMLLFMQSDPGRVPLWFESAGRAFEEHEVSFGRVISWVRGLFAELSSVLPGEQPVSTDEEVLDLASSCDSYPELCRALASHVVPGDVRLEDADLAGAPAVFAELCAYLRKHFREPLSSGELARRFRMSESYLRKLFREYKGTSFKDYLTSLRIEEAKRLLSLTPHLPIKAVAASVGFKDEFYFSRVFRERTGISPTAYRGIAGKSM